MTTTYNIARRSGVAYTSGNSSDLSLSAATKETLRRAFELCTNASPFSGEVHVAGVSASDSEDTDSPFAEFAGRLPNESSLRALREDEDEMRQFDTFDDWADFVDAL